MSSKGVVNDPSLFIKKRNSINLYFFDNQTEEMHYVKGIMYGCYHPYKSTIIVRDQREDLVTKVLDLITKQEAEETYDIVKQPGKHSYWFQIQNLPELIEKFEDMGLGADKMRRQFPANTPNQFMVTFLRGFSESRVTFCVNGIQYYFGNSFLTDMYKNLVPLYNKKLEELGLEHVPDLKLSPDKEVKSNLLTFSPLKSAIIGMILYDGIQEDSELYCPSVKAKFDSLHSQFLQWLDEPNMARDKERIIEFLLTHPHTRIDELAAHFGFNLPSTFSNAFKRHKGCSPTEFIVNAQKKNQ